jgi:O-antigen ligase
MTPIPGNPSPARPWWHPAPAVAPASVTVAPADPSGRLPFIVLLAFTALLFLAPQIHFPVLQPLRLPFVAACFALGSYLLDRLSHGAPLTIRARELAILAALLAWAVFTLPASLWPGGSVDAILDTYSKSLVIFFLLVNLVVTPSRLRRMIWLLTLLSLPLAVSALANYHSGVFVQGGNERIFGYQAPLTENPNDLALLLNITLPLSAGLLFAETRRWARAMILLIMAIDAAAVITTFSRAGFFVLATVVGLYLWKIARRRGGTLAAVLVVLALACVPLLPGGYLQRIGTSFDTSADTTGSAEARWTLTQGALGYVARHPLVGAGIGMGILAMNEQLGHGVWKQVHNIYLEYAVDLGLPGLAFFLLMLGSALGGSRLTQRNLERAGAPHALVSLHEGVQVSLLTFAVAALFSPGAYGWIVHYSLGMAVAARNTCVPWSAPIADSRPRERAR